MLNRKATRISHASTVSEVEDQERSLHQSSQIMTDSKQPVRDE